MSAVRVRLAFKDLAYSEIALRVYFPHLIELGCLLHRCLRLFCLLWLLSLLLATLNIYLGFSLLFGLLLLGGSRNLGLLNLLLFDSWRAIYS
jgi:hypothetical protein